MSLCLYCRQNFVPLNKWNSRCSECLVKYHSKSKKLNTKAVSSREPAAIIEAKGHEVFVDKFGKEVDNPGYDTKNDARGWNYTGKSKRTKTVIL